LVVALNAGTGSSSLNALVKAFDRLHTNIGGGNLFDVMADGKRIIVLPQSERTDERKENLHITFLMNFLDEVRRRMPAGGK
jgi:hypothetical protein